MKPEYYEVKCGNCRFWHSWKSFARKNERSVRRAVQKGAETGCDGKCCCYESGMDKNDVTYELFRDGQKVSFNFFSSAEITQKGSYRLLCTDDVGNTTEYVFEIDYMSNSTILLIAVVVTIVVAIIVALIIVRFRRRKY